MAQHELPGGPTHVLMARANELAKVNGKGGAALPFAQVDIGFAEMLDTIRSTKNQRDMDLIFVTNLYHKAWMSLHITMGVMGETLNAVQESEVRDVYTALNRLEMGHLMRNGLSKKCSRWLNK
jgi:hypothetical protein